MAEQTNSVPDIDTATITPIVREALGAPTANLHGGWSCRRLGGGAGRAAGVYHVAGRAQVSGMDRPWSMVLKILPPADGAAPFTWEYPPREALAYRSGLLTSLPAGIIAPRCFAVAEQPDGTTWLWLEEIVDQQPGPWSLDRHVHVAHRLGRFNGASLRGAPLPDDAWLDHRMRRDLVESAGQAVVDLDRLTGPSAPPLVRRYYPPPVMAAIRWLLAEREALFVALERLPHTLCHRDAHRRNLFERSGPDGTAQLVAIDWAYVGHGAVGEDLAAMVLSDLLFFETPGIPLQQFDAACFAAYLDGLRDAGWAGDARSVRFGYVVAAALRYGLGVLPGVGAIIADPALHPFWEQTLGRSIPEVVDAWATVSWPFLLGLIEEAREMLHSGA